MKEKPIIPLYIVEEHHEAFFSWTYAYHKGFIPPMGNTLLHVDSHADMVVAPVIYPIDVWEDDLAVIYEHVYRYLGIASFIVPAIYKGLINNYTFMDKYDAYQGEKEYRYVATYRPEGIYFSMGKVTPLLRTLMENEDNSGSDYMGWGNYAFTSYQEIGPGSSFDDRQPVILDIDLDYFSCDNSLSSTEKKIEITRAAYESFNNDKYHPFRIFPVPALKVRQEGESFYMIYTEWQDMPPNLGKVSTPVIDKRINNLIDFLSRNKIKPKIIDICRSRFSGYTPPDQWQYIEEKLLAALQDIYEVEVTDINGLGESV